MSTRITILIAGAAVAGVAVIGGGIANASAQDDQFLQMLSQDGIDVTNAGDVIKGAHELCDSLAQGATPAQITQDLVGTGKFNQTDANNILQASVTAYCSNQQSRLGT